MEQNTVLFRNKGMYQDPSVSKSSDEFAFKNVNIRITAVNDTTQFSVTNEKLPSSVEIVDAKPTNVITLTFTEPSGSYQYLTARSQYIADVNVVVRYGYGDWGEYDATILSGDDTSSQVEVPYEEGTTPTISIETFGESEYQYILQGQTIESTIVGNYIGKCIIGDYLVLFTHYGDYDRIYRCWIDGNYLKFKLIAKTHLAFTGPIEAVGSYEREDIIKVYWVDGHNPNRVINIMTDLGDQPDSFDFLPNVDSFPSGTISKSYDGNGAFPSGVIQYFASYYNNLGQETKIVWASELQYITLDSRGGKPDETINCSFTISLSYIDQSFDYVRIYSAKRTSLDSPIEAGIVGDYKISGSTLSVIDTNTNIESIDASLLYYIGGDSFTATTIEDKDNVLFFGDIETTGSIVINNANDIQTLFVNNIEFGYKQLNMLSDNNHYSYDFLLNNQQENVATFKYGETYRVAIQFQTNTGEWTNAIYIKDITCDKCPVYSTQSDSNVYVAGINVTWPTTSLLSEYVNYRLLIAKTSESTRNIIAQGVINPTVFNLKERFGHSPDILSSWVTRPSCTEDIANKHMDIIGPDAEGSTTNVAEIQCSDKRVSPTSDSDHSGHVADNGYQYYVDTSVVDLNSPDIMYGESNTSGLKFRIVGAAEVGSTYADYEMSVSNKMFPESSVTPRLRSGLLLNDYLYNLRLIYDNGPLNYDFAIRFKVYMWHKSRPSFGIPDLTDYDTIDNKLFSNYTYCGYSRFFVSPYQYTNGVDVSIFNPDVSSLIRCGDKFYYGNYDTLVVNSEDGYPIQVLGNNGQAKDAREEYTNGSWSGDKLISKDPVRIQYNSTKHAVVATKKISNVCKILPRLTYGDAYDIEAMYGEGTSTIFDFDTSVQYSQDRITSFIQTYGGSVEHSWTSKHILIGEIYRELTANQLYGSDPEKNTYIPASSIKSCGTNISAYDTFGDTYFQRWECLRTYPTAELLENSVVDIVSFMVETHINVDGRSDINRGYINQKNARPTNFGLVNPVYSQYNNIFSYNILDDRFEQTKFPTEFAWSLNKSIASKTDSWANISLSNIENVDGKYGKINAIEKLNDTLVCFQDKAICVINFNNRTQISTEQGTPIELANSGKVNSVTYITTNYGCKNKFSIVNAKTGLYFIDDENRALIRIGKDGLADISTSCGMSVWFDKASRYGALWNGGNLNSTSFVLQYDSNRGDIYIMTDGKNEENCIVYNEILGTFTSFFGYKYPLMWNERGETYCFDNDDSFGVPQVIVDKLFGNTNYSNDYSIDYRINPEPLVDKIFTNIEYVADMLDGTSVETPSILEDKHAFNKINCWNEYQTATGDLTQPQYGTGSLKTKFRIRRADIPRPSTNYGLDRMRNPWIHLKLSKENSQDTELMEFHSLAVKYFK